MSNLREELEKAFELGVSKDDVPVEKIEEVVEAPEPVDQPIEEENVTEPDASVENTDDEEDEIRELKNWNKTDKEIYKSLDVKGREFLLRRHREMQKDHTQKLQANAENQKIAEKYKEIIAPRSDYLKQIGMEPLHAVAYLIDTEKKLRFGTRYEKQQAIEQLSKVYDIPLNGSAQIQDEVPQLDEATKLILNKLNAHEQYMANEVQEKQRNQRTYLESVVTNFAQEKDESGNSKYPHFEEVKKTMGDLLTSKLAESMEDAYEQAVFKNKTLREDYLKRYNNFEKREADNRDKAIASKKAGFNVKSKSSDGIVDQRKTLSLRDTVKRDVEAAYASGRGRI